MSISRLNAQTAVNDTLKKVSADTLTAEENSDELEDKISYEAQDSIVSLPELGKAYLYGKAKINYGGINIDADNIEIDYKKSTVLAYGSKDSTGKLFGTPVFKDDGESMEAEKIMYNLKSKKGKIFNALTRQGELLVFGSEIKKDSINNVYFKEMRCLPCQDEDARTAFRATKAKAIPNDKIITGPLFLEVGGVPTIIGLPFGFFPNTKKQANGILIPTFNNSEQFGYGLKQGGYYFGISDKTDMIIRGDIYTNGTWALSATNNYKVLYKYSGSTYVNYSHWNTGDKDIPATYSKSNAYQIRWVHTQDNKSDPTSRFSANVNYVGNQSYNRFNAENTDQYLQNTFQSNINYTKSFKFSSLSINGSSSQNSKTSKVDINLPSLTYNVNRFFPFKRETAGRQNIFDKFGMSYMLEATNSLSGIDSTLFKGSTVDSMVYGLRHTIPMSTNFNILKYITASPAVNLSAVMYPKTIEKELYAYEIKSLDGKKDSTAYAIKNNNVKGFATGYEANFSTAFNTKIYFDYFFKKGKVKQIRHLLIPTLTYNYRPDYGADKYGFYKTVPLDTAANATYKYSIFEKAPYGGPAAGKQNAFSLSLNNNIESKQKVRSDTGFTYKKVVLLQNLGLVGSYNMAADSFKMSNISVTARTILFKYFDINASASFDPYDYDNSYNRRTSNYLYKVDGRLIRFVSANFAVNTSIGSDMIKEMKKARQSPSLTNGAEQGAEKPVASDRLPWNIRVNYNLQLLNPDDRKMQPTQSLNFSSSVQPSKFWKIGITSGFDFTNQKLSYTSLNIYRDLKCWEARIDWVPFGPRKMYNLSINLKTSMLSEFKIPKRSIPRVQGY